MPDSDLEKYVMKRPLPTYKEKIDEVEAALKQWAKRKYYRQRGIKLADVASELEIATTHITYCVSARMKMNFAAWINSLRIEDAKQQMKKNPAMTPIEIASKLGYSTVAVFRTNFVKFVGYSPEEYSEQFRTERPADIN